MTDTIGVPCPCTSAKPVPVECLKALSRDKRGGFACEDGHWTSARARICRETVGHSSGDREPGVTCQWCAGCGRVVSAAECEDLIDEAISQAIGV